MSHTFSIVILGSTGAVGGHAATTFASMPQVERLTLLGRRPLEGVRGEHIAQHSIDVLNPASYADLLPGHDVAVCTFGVGEPSKFEKDYFRRIDKEAVLDFARACRQAGIRHFELLASVGANAGSKSFYLRTKGELEDGLRALHFERLSLFHPSMILTPQNRYGFLQGVTLWVWPWLKLVFLGPLRKYRGIAVEQLGKAIALNVVEHQTGEETLYWDDFITLVGQEID